MVKTTNYHFKNILYLNIFYINIYIVVYHEWFEQQRNMALVFVGNGSEFPIFSETNIPI